MKFKHFKSARSLSCISVALFLFAACKQVSTESDSEARKKTTTTPSKEALTALDKASKAQGLEVCTEFAFKPHVIQEGGAGWGNGGEFKVVKGADGKNKLGFMSLGIKPSMMLGNSPWITIGFTSFAPDSNSFSNETQKSAETGIFPEKSAFHQSILHNGQYRSDYKFTVLKDGKGTGKEGFSGYLVPFANKNLKNIRIGSVIITNETKGESTTQTFVAQMVPEENACIVQLANSKGKLGNGAGYIYVHTMPSIEETKDMPKTK
jgi:hypothetical protein